MSLDVYLRGKTLEVPCCCPHCDHKHTRMETEEFFSANITHNLNKMAEEAGIYKACWHPSEIGISKASQLIEPLRNGIALMKADPERFKKHDSPNGWGLYVNFLPWLENYLAACEAHPDADVHVWR